MKPIGNLQEAVIVIKNLLLARGIKILDTNQVIVDYYQGKPIYHSRIITNLGIYHIKFQKKEQIPRSSTLMSGAVNADERLKFVIKMFGKELLSNIGINLNVILDLLEIEEKKQISTYFINVIGNGAIYWRECNMIYKFAMAYGTVIYDSKTYGTSIIQVPSGWLLPWNEPIKGYPNIVH